MQQLIALMTDFGLADPYLGQVKGMIAKMAPECRVIDLCHDLEPFALTQGAFILASSAKYFPKGTVFTAVVDPGVGGQRKVVCVQADGCLFLAPDNGLLSLVLDSPNAVRAFDMTPGSNGGLSQTFHGRDLFAPLAVQLAMDESPELFGEEIPFSELTTLPWLKPEYNDAKLELHVLHVDRFGNLILNAPAEWADKLASWSSISLGELQNVPLVNTYCELEKGQLGLLKGSQGYMELAVNMDSAAVLFDYRAGDAIELMQVAS